MGCRRRSRPLSARRAEGGNLARFVAGQGNAVERLPVGLPVRLRR